MGGDVVLVTLACPIRGVRAAWQDAPDLQIIQSAPLLDQERAQAFLHALGKLRRGRITLEADLPPGMGAGMSTAALVALARAVGADEHQIAQACLLVEGASDPLMLAMPDTVIWASRRAQVVADALRPPTADILGGFSGPAVMTNPTDMDFPDIEDLVAEWRNGPDLAQAARLASLSAERTTALRGPASDPMPDLARALGALGWVRAHTGAARGLIFAPGTVPHHGRDALREAGLTHVFCFTTGAGA